MSVIVLIEQLQSLLVFGKFRFQQFLLVVFEFFVPYLFQELETYVVVDYLYAHLELNVLEAFDEVCEGVSHHSSGYHLFEGVIDERFRSHLRNAMYRLTHKHIHTDNSMRVPLLHSHGAVLASVSPFECANASDGAPDSHKLFLLFFDTKIVFSYEALEELFQNGVCDYCDTFLYVFFHLQVCFDSLFSIEAKLLPLIEIILMRHSLYLLYYCLLRLSRFRLLLLQNSLLVMLLVPILVIIATIAHILRHKRHFSQLIIPIALIQTQKRLINL